MSYEQETTCEYNKMNKSDFLSLALGRGQEVQTFYGFQTYADCRSWFEGRKVLFDEVLDWLVAGDMIDRVSVYRDDIAAEMAIGFSQVADAVAFRLTWNDHFAFERPLHA